jgi:cell division initiation protein
MQNLTPLEIQKQLFPKALKGFAQDDVRAYLQLVAEEVERLVRENDRLSRENANLSEQIGEISERERILKNTLLSAQRFSEELRENARKEAELIVKDAELLSERIVGQAMQRVGELEKTIQDLKVHRRAARTKLGSALETFQHLITLDAEEEANDLPITQLYQRRS